MKKEIILLVYTLIILQLAIVSGINLDMQKQEISSMAILDLNIPAEFLLSITNQGESGNFEIYSLVGIPLEPKEIFIAQNETKQISLKAYPAGDPRYYSFEYRIKDSSGKLQKDTLVINIVDLTGIFDVQVEDITP